MKHKNKYILVLLTVISLATILFFLLKKNNKVPNEDFALDYINKTIEFRNNMIGKELHKLDNLIIENGFYSECHAECTVFLIYNSFDCSSCINDGLSVMAENKDLLDNFNTFIVLSGEKISKQYDYDMSNFNVINDNHEEIRRELSYFHTPAIYVLKNNKIEYIYFSLSYDNVTGWSKDDERQRFIDKLQELLQ